jgi:hypothetical protein
VEYTVDGQTYTVRNQKFVNGYDVGDPIDVIYDPANPTISQVDIFSERWFDPIMELIPSYKRAPSALSDTSPICDMKTFYHNQVYIVGYGGPQGASQRLGWCQNYFLKNSITSFKLPIRNAIRGSKSELRKFRPERKLSAELGVPSMRS